MNRLNFNQSIGFPLETEILDEMQKAWRVLNALGYMAGNYAILSGCEVVGTNVSDGVVFINGEVLEFRGGVANTTVIIIEEPELREFKDGNSREVIYNRYVSFGTATVSYDWANFKRGFPTIEIEAALAAKAPNTVIANLIERLENLEARAVPIIKITSGQDTVSSYATSTGSFYNDNYDYNYFDVYPPAGYTLAHLQGFIPSVNQIDYRGEVDGNDWLWCKHKPWPVVSPNRIRVICANSETDTAPKLNWLAIWIK